MRLAKGVMVAGSGRDLRRVSLYADGRNVDLALPAAVPVAALLPSIVDILSSDGSVGSEACVPSRYQLSRPGTAALNLSMTLAQSRIQDGAVLVLTRSSTELPAPCFHDAAEAVSTTLAATAQPWTPRAARLTGAVAAAWLAGLGAALLTRSSLVDNSFRPADMSITVVAIVGSLALLAAAIAHRVYRDEIAGLTLGLLATGFAACAGLLAVPDGPGAPNVLLAAVAAGMASVLAMRLSGCGSTTFRTVSCLALMIAGAALTTVITTAPLRAIGSVSVLASVGLLEMSARISIAWAGLSPRLPVDVDTAGQEGTQAQMRRKSLHAHNRLTSLVVASAAAAAIAAVCTAIKSYAAGGPRLGAVVFAAITGAVLLLRARSYPDLARRLALLGAGTATLSATLVLAAQVASQHPAWLATITALSTASAFYLGFVAPALSFSPIARRSVELLEYSGLAAMVPLACWICGFYSAARGMRLL